MNIVVDYETMAEGLKKSPFVNEFERVAQYFDYPCGIYRRSTFFSSIESI